MDSPFFRNYNYAPTSPFYAPTSPYYAYPSPAHSTMPTRRPAPRPAHTQPSARVVNIPIHFVGSDRSRSEAAVRIQKVFRGFLVRRAVKKIRTVRAEVGAMERRFEDGGMADGLRKDERERLRVNELLMGLLFRLDSVPGVDSAVRDCRKKVIRRVVALQERVDALAQEVNDSETRDSTDPDLNPDSVVEEKVDPDQTMEARDHKSDSISEDATMESGQMVCADQAMKGFVDQAMETRDSTDSTLEDATKEAEQVVHVDEAMKGSVDHAIEIRNSSDSDHDHGSDSISEDATIEDDQIAHEDPNQKTKEFVDGEENLASGDEECVVNAIQEARKEGITNAAVGERGNKCADERDLEEVMERMEEENKKLQRMISELCEREVSQSRLMNSLLQRVEALEKKATKRKTKKTKPCNARKGRYDL